MKPFEKTTMLRPLTEQELLLEEPEWLDEDTVIFYIPCWFNPDEVFSDIHVNTCENDDYINLYCLYSVKTHTAKLSIYYVNNSGDADEKDFDVDVGPEERTQAILLQKVSEWLKSQEKEETEND